MQINEIDTKTCFFVGAIRGNSSDKKLGVVTDVYEANDTYTHKTFECWISKYITDNFPNAEFSDPEVWKVSSKEEALNYRKGFLELYKTEDREIKETGKLEQTSC